jgi:hypothetical protein
VRAAFGPTWPGYTNSTMMTRAVLRVGRLTSATRAFSTLAEDAALAWPRYGLALVQWEGPWTDPCAPSRERYARIDRAKRTHWIGARTRPDNSVDVWDINALVDDLGGWRPLVWWQHVIAPQLTAEHKRATGKWHITHAIEIDRPAGAP